MRKPEARERVLQAAESLFIIRGYDAVTVKDIAQVAGIHHASIYHHIPGGKADLFVEVMRRHLQQHQIGIQQALAGTNNDVRAQLVAIASWLLSQPPLDLIRLTNTDLPALDPVVAEQLSTLAFTVLLIPIVEVLESAQVRGELGHPNLGNIAGALLSSIQGLHTVPDAYVPQSRLKMAEQIIDVMLRGLKAS